MFCVCIYTHVHTVKLATAQYSCTESLGRTLVNVGHFNNLVKTFYTAGG